MNRWQNDIIQVTDVMAVPELRRSQILVFGGLFRFHEEINFKN